ncbi:MAG: GH92 family glycosyl hydrolase, partial [Pseudomonadota bacterium]
DTTPPHRTNGYRSDLPLQGFSHTHVSGTGGQGRFGNISLTPFTGEPAFRERFEFERKDERAEVGRYRVTLTPDNVEVDLTATPRCGISRFTFPTDQPANVLIDATAVHHVPGMDGPTAKCTASQIIWTSDTDFNGSGVYEGGWGHYYPYTIHFAGEVSHAPERRVADDGQCILHWSTTQTIEVRIGISFVSQDNARESLLATRDLTFEDIHLGCRDAWQLWFDRIQVEGGTDDQRTLFHTFLTRLLCMPADLGVDDEFHHWPSKIRHFSEFYCLWDSVRNANSLLMLFAPELQRDMLNCLLEVGEQTGWLPDAWITGHSTKVQGGSSADILFSEARQKGISGIDYERALKQVLKNSQVESPDPYQFGRYLPHYRDHGYVSTDAVNCVSRHLEYAYQDWCAGALAESLGQDDVAAECFRNAGKLWNLWHEKHLHFAPKTPDGEWAEPFDPNVCRPDSWNDPSFYEGTSRRWSYNTQHDFAGLVSRCGGEKAFEERLDTYFADKQRITKETFMHIPFLYHYARRPDKSSAALRNALNKAYSTARNGLPDNEDMGCHSALYICGMLGLYPMMGQDWYFLTAPAFTHCRLQLGESGKELIIDAPLASQSHLYITCATLNGKPWTQSWIRHRDIVGGGHLAFELSEHASEWGMGNVPPSPMANRKSQLE